MRVSLPIELDTKLLIAGELMPELKSDHLLNQLEWIAQDPAWRAGAAAVGLKSPIVLKVLRLFAAAARRRKQLLNRSSCIRRGSRTVQSS